ncbi:hemerythrin domain-containing protein [Streptomyces sp. TP-A0874]|uniref:hemerythrin domain-containing protein n=1 Tax=Streptomyces sp. TP-A0874 TaxID=549819 RepID=UPI0008530368|nr:hemerythrin domain-containing protein [Streptomyces sp. TP-A0874]
MGESTKERARAAELPDGDVIGVLLKQHARIRELMQEVKTTSGEHKKHAFDELRALLAVHETGEEMVLRPVSKKTAGTEVADARNHEEDEANHVLVGLEKMDTSTADFDEKFASFESSVLEHAEKEETKEFPSVLAERSEEERQKMGARLLRAEKLAPTHPHPGAAGSPAKQWSVGPFAGIVDKVRDAVGRKG